MRRFSNSANAFALALCLGMFAFTRPANAQSAGEKAAAETLFDKGVELLKAGNVEEACPKLEASQVAPAVARVVVVAPPPMVGERGEGEGAARGRGTRFDDRCA